MIKYSPYIKSILEELERDRLQLNFYNNGTIEFLSLDTGLQDRNDGPAFVSLAGENWYKNGVHHRDGDKPSTIVSNLIAYAMHGVEHRDNGLASLHHNSGIGFSGYYCWKGKRVEHTNKIIDMRDNKVLFETFGMDKAKDMELSYLSQNIPVIVIKDSLTDVYAGKVREELSETYKREFRDEHKKLQELKNIKHSHIIIHERGIKQSAWIMNKHNQDFIEKNLNWTTVEIPYDKK